MQFQVPQFIETEDKIIGPFTLKQFVYIAIGAGLTLSLFFYFNLFLWGFLAVLINTTTLCLAFVKINGIPLPKVASSAITYFWKPKFYLWKKPKAPGAPKIEKVAAGAEEVKEKVNPLNDIWQRLLTSKAPIPTREKSAHPGIFDQFKTHQEKYEVFRKITGEKEVARRVDYK